MAFPTSINFTDLQLSSITPTQRTASLSGIEQRAAIGAQYWQATGTFANLTATERRTLHAFLMSTAGSLNSFEIVLPDTISDTTSGYASSLTTATASAGNTDIQVSGTGTTTAIKAGDFFKFSSHTKVYMATQDCDLTSGTGTLNFFPGVRQGITSGQTITFNNVPMTVRLTDDTITQTINPTLLSSFTISFTEVLS